MDIVELQVHDVSDSITKPAVGGRLSRCRSRKKKCHSCARGAVNYPVHLDLLRMLIITQRGALALAQCANGLELINVTVQGQSDCNIVNLHSA
jgi:hypothetical protein